MAGKDLYKCRPFLFCTVGTGSRCVHKEATKMEDIWLKIRIYVEAYCIAKRKRLFQNDSKSNVSSKADKHPNSNNDQGLSLLVSFGLEEGPI